jgi:hypothetical protein
VKDAFPLPGTYHFRFKCPLYPGGDRDKGAMPVWMDSINDSDLIPTWKNAVVAKVTRISMEDEDDDDDDFQRPAAAPAPAPAPAPSNPRAPPSHQSSMASQGSQGSSDHLDIFDGPAPASSTPAPAATGNLFDTHAPAPASGGSLLDMNDTYGRQAQPAASTAHHDFLGMTAAPAAHQAQPGYPAAAAPNMYQAQQQQQQQQRPPQQQQPNTFNNFSNQNSAFGGLGTPWKP